MKLKVKVVEQWNHFGTDENEISASAVETIVR